jgi:hypothetical protein
MKNNMNKEFIPYEQALELKQLGFDEPCFGYYNTTWSKQNELLFPQYAGELENWNEMTHLCSSPLYSQAFRWFRENYNIISYTKIYMIVDGVDEYHYEIKIDKIRLHRENPMYTFNTYEEAELACLKKLIEIVKTK